MPNPRTREYPLQHRFGYHFNLQEFESAHTHMSTQLPLIFADQAKTEALADAVQVHPMNDSYEDVVQDPACFMNSRVNNIKITEYCSIPKEIDEPDSMYWKAIFSFGIGDSDVVAADGTTLLSKLLFTKTADAILPTYTAGADLEHASLMATSVTTLDTTQSIEGVGSQPASIITHKRGELGAKVKAMVDGPFANRVHKDYPYYRSRWYKTPSRTRRMNAFCGCFLYVSVSNSFPDATTNAASGSFGIHFDDRLTIEEESMDFHYVMEYNEYNDNFDQSP